MTKFKKYGLPLGLILLLIIVLFWGNHISVEIKSFFYALSLSIKNIISFLLPFIIFSFLFHSLISLKQKAALLVVVLLTTVFCSNFIAIMIGYSVGSIFLPIFSNDIDIVQNSANTLKAMWKFPLPQIISNEAAIITGILSGLFFAVKPHHQADRIAKLLNKWSTNFLSKIFIPILPLFVLGFIFKLQHEDILHQVFSVYGTVLILIVSTQISYIIILYLVAAKFSIGKCCEYLKNILPATITGFSTISSAATMPVTIISTEKNLNDKTFAHMIIPATCNIHTLGSAIGLTILVLASLIALDYGLPTFNVFIIFAFYYALSKFAVAGIPGGVVIVVSPLLEAYLGFTPEMVGLVTTIYLLFDPFGTASNVTLNGAFAIIFNRLFKSLSSNKNR